jgi:ADP-L-glycero-D-manno-heptose 6-epimerase
MKDHWQSMSELKSALVTGATGFIGRNLTDALVQRGIQVIAVGRRALPQDSLPVRRIVATSFDALDQALLEDVDLVFHLAAITDTRVEDDLELLRVNVDEPVRLFERALRHGCRVVYASSMAVYGNVPTPFREGGEHQPLNPYGRSKLRLDHSVERLAASTDGVVVGLRFANVYGPHEAHKGPMASMVSQLMQQMRSGDPVLFEHGDQRRDFIHVADAVSSCLLAAGAKGSCIVNCGSGRSVSFNQLIYEINRALGTDRRPRYVKNPHPEVYQSDVELDISLARRKIGYEPSVSLRDGIRRMIVDGA